MEENDTNQKNEQNLSGPSVVPAENNEVNNNQTNGQSTPGSSPNMTDFFGSSKDSATSDPFQTEMADQQKTDSLINDNLDQIKPETAPSVNKTDDNFAAEQPMSVLPQTPQDDSANGSSTNTNNPMTASIYPEPDESATEPITQDSKIDMQNSIIYGGFWIRLLAGLIDSLILAIFSIAINFLLFKEQISVAMDPTTPSLPLTAPLLITLLIVILYYIIMTSTLGWTLGKRIFKLKVVEIDTQNKISWGKVILREIIGKFISNLVIFLGYIWIGFDAKKQGWHDKIASTVVIKEKF